MTFDQDERALLARLADVLIPAVDGNLSASQAGVAGEGLDQVLIARPDLAPGLKDLLTKARGREPHECVADLRQNDLAGFGVLTEIVPAAYFLNAAVQHSIGYAGQGPRAIDPHPDYLDDGLLDSVIRRGPVYRPTPK